MESWRAASAAVFVLLASPALGQRASQNAVTEAKDAFGSSVGGENIGLYSSDSVRGFSPEVAGNVRIEGLYFDEVTGLNSRLTDSSQIRVGIAAQGYAFPAPTGVLDYSLRTPGDNQILSALSEINTRGTGSLEFDGVQPIDDDLSLGLGAGFHRDVEADGTANYQTSQGVLVSWRPLPGLALLPFWSRSDTYDEHQNQVYVPLGAFLPPIDPGRHFFGPDWAINRQFNSNFGVLARLDFLDDWTLRAGLFRSNKKKPHDYFVQLTDVTRAGLGELNVVANPAAHWGSTSGEVRLEHELVTGPLTHRAILSVRVRDWNAVYGGADSRDLGVTRIGQRAKVAKPVFHYGARTRDHVGEITPGASYQLTWAKVGILGVSVQQPQYRKRTLIPGSTPAISTASPWLLNLALTAILSPDLAVYGDSTRGLEDNGTAPQNATNRNQALPAIATRQKDAGLRWRITNTLGMVVGAFDIHKPYFNLSPAGLYAKLGEIENKGLEFSLDGDILPGLDIVAGSVFSQPDVTGEAVKLGIVGHRPVDIPARQSEFDVNWTPAQGESDWSFGLTLDHQTSRAATIDDRVSLPSQSILSNDVRYRFHMGGHPASLRVWFENLFDNRYWQLNGGAGAYSLYYNSGRRIDFRLIVDV